MAIKKFGKLGSKAEILVELLKLEEVHLKEFYKLIRELESSEVPITKEQIAQLDTIYDTIQHIITPINMANLELTAIVNKRVLLAETNKRQIHLCKMALRGTGVYLDIATSLEEGEEFLNSETYDIVCSGTELIELLQVAGNKNPGTHTVYITNDPMEEYLSYLFKYPFLSNIVSIQKDDRTYILQNILSTISKIMTKDLWGLEKYLHWGVEVRFFPVTSSEKRDDLIDELEEYMDRLGIRRTIKGRVISVTEELLMNAIYDAPADKDGKAKYNHLNRTVPVELPQDEHGQLKFACDGNLFAVSVEDPFGRLDKKIIFDYLKDCYGGHETVHQDKGGAGHGLYQIMETCDLLVINVKPSVKTEVICIFNIDPQYAHKKVATSFHYFC